MGLAVVAQTAAKSAQKVPQELLRDFYVSLLDYSSGTMAPLGQVSLQEPQSRQAAESMTYWSSPWLIAPAGQTSAQEPQLTQAEVIL